MWGSTPTDPKTYVHVETLEDFRRSKLHQPELSLKAFLAALSAQSTRCGSEASMSVSCSAICCPTCSVGCSVPVMLQAGFIDPQNFIKVYHEWCAADLEIQRQFVHVEPFVCPACHPILHSVHVDANMKLYTWSSEDEKEPWRQSYYKDGEWLFVADVDAVTHERLTDLAMGIQVKPC